MTENAWLHCWLAGWLYLLLLCCSWFAGLSSHSRNTTSNRSGLSFRPLGACKLPHTLALEISEIFCSALFYSSFASNLYMFPEKCTYNTEVRESGNHYRDKKKMLSRTNSIAHTHYTCGALLSPLVTVVTERSHDFSCA